MVYKIGKGDALVIVDLQRDFCLGGALAVEGADSIVPTLNNYSSIFSRSGGKVYATRDWHPSNHTSFKGHGGTWPPHCVQDSPGAEFHPQLILPEGTVVISKGTETEKEAYSGFDGTSLAEGMKRSGIGRVFVGGLATDYCVKSTVLDALGNGFETILLADAIRGVNVGEGDSKRAVAAMIGRGARRAVLGELRWE
jgi:nicotinamidase/pyrazinamidase